MGPPDNADDLKRYDDNHLSELLRQRDVDMLGAKLKHVLDQYMSSEQQGYFFKHLVTLFERVYSGKEQFASKDRYYIFNSICDVVAYESNPDYKPLKENKYRKYTKLRQRITTITRCIQPQVQFRSKRCTIKHDQGREKAK